MKKITSLLFIIVILCSACGTNQVNNATTTENVETTQAQSTLTLETSIPANNNIQISAEALRGVQIHVWTPWYNTEQSLFESLVKQFNNENQWGIQVNVQSQINYSNLYENVTNAIAKPDQPDLVISLPEHAQEWYANDAVTNLNRYVQDVNYGFDTSDFADIFLKQDFSGTERIGMPAQRTAQILLWNETWAKELGFNTAPTSVENFRKQTCGAHASKLNDEIAENDAQGGWLVNTEAMTAYAWLLAFDGSVLEENSYRFMKPENIDAFRFLRELSETNCAWQNTSDPILSFANREALFITTSLEELPTVARVFANVSNQDVWKVLPFPNQQNGVLAIYGSSYVIMQSTDEKQLASWLLMRWLLDSKQDARFVEATHLFPLRTSTLNLLGDYVKTHPQWQQTVDLIPQGVLQPQLGSWRTIKIMFGDGFAHMYRVNIPSGQVPAILAQMENTASELSE
jgi:multiple sugar transport system substrate-binding protein